VIALLLAAAMLEAPSKAEQLSDVQRVYDLAQAALLECMRNKSVELDDGMESAALIARASVTACSEVRKKAVFLGTWKRTLTSKDRGPEAAQFAATVQDGIDKKFEEQAVLIILENRAKKNASNK
jgi:hypothetical protein